MTLGEKLKAARLQAGFTQTQLAEKLSVSRQAITKWETGSGMPDIENLRAISTLLGVSIDYLLDNDASMDRTLIRESFDLAAYGGGLKKAKKDRLMREKYPQAVISTLLGKPMLTKSEKVIDNALGFLTNAPFGIPDLINQMKNLDKEFYLVERSGTQFLVMVTDKFIESRPLREPVSGKRFKLDGWEFINCGPVKA